MATTPGDLAKHAPGQGTDDFGTTLLRIFIDASAPYVDDGRLKQRSTGRSQQRREVSDLDSLTRRFDPREVHLGPEVSAKEGCKCV